MAQRRTSGTWRGQCRTETQGRREGSCATTEGTACPVVFQLRRDSRPDTGHRESAFVARAIHVLMGSRDRRESYSVAYEDHPAPAPHGRRGMACSKYFLPLEIQYYRQIRPN